MEIEHIRKWDVISTVGRVRGQKLFIHIFFLYNVFYIFFFQRKQNCEYLLQLPSLALAAHMCLPGYFKLKLTCLELLSIYEFAV